MFEISNIENDQRMRNRVSSPRASVTGRGDATVTVKFDDLSLAFDFVGSAAPGENNAYICLDTGQIYCTSELSPLDEEVPDDLETSDRYLLLPHKTELDLGKGLALRFTASELPDPSMHRPVISR